VKESPIECLIIAKEVAKEAGEKISDQNSNARRVNSSEGKDVKVQGDLISESIILKKLQNCSTLPVLSEEKGKIGDFGSEQPYWVVDPLDGSLNFSRGLPLCCISIALWQNKAPLLGVIYDFNRKELFSGIVGQGAWLNEQPIGVSAVKEKKNAVLTTGFPIRTDFSNEGITTFTNDIQQYKKVRLLGTAALSLAYVACGRVDAYHEQNIMLWDIAGGCAIVQAAGGRFEIKEKEDLFHPIDVLAQNNLL
jgi:myo-inositol-1(or 4)-monophosphatase